MVKSTTERSIVPVILSGGMGSRLWPLSRTSLPKQFLSLNSNVFSLLQETALRVDDASMECPIIVCSNEHKDLIKSQMKQIGILDYHVLLEPCGRNTAPAIAAAAQYIMKKYGNAYMIVLSVDHVITSPDIFIDAVYKAKSLAAQGHLITFGIEASAPKTGFGYIKSGKTLGEEGFLVDCFIEKPSLERAVEYCKDGSYRWNSGIFLFSASDYINELEKFEPDMVQYSAQALEKSQKTDTIYLLDEGCFSQIRDISIDYAVMEHTDRAAVVPVNCGWGDTGSWDALWELQEKDNQGNVILGQNYLIDSQNSYINSSHGVSIACIGLNDVAIISAPDIVLVMPRERSQDVKQIVNLVKEQKPELLDAYKTKKLQ